MSEKSFCYLISRSHRGLVNSKFEIVCVRLILKKWESADIPGHDKKLTSDMNLILAS